MQASQRLIFILLPLSATLAMESAGAALNLDGPAGSGDPRFYQQLRTALASLERSADPYIRQLHAAVVAAPGMVGFRQMTDDPATWSNDGDPDRGHTEPADSRPKRAGRTQPTGATIFVPRSALEPGSARWNSGLLVHELVHALDLAGGRYNRDYTVRERRAVFMQNIWRQHAGHRLRVAYHGKFATVDYQYALRRGAIAQYAQYIFARADFPPAPAQAHAGAPRTAACGTPPRALPRAAGLRVTCG